MSDYPMLISNKLHSFRNFLQQIYNNLCHFSKNYKKIFKLMKKMIENKSFRQISIR